MTIVTDSPSVHQASFELGNRHLVDDELWTRLTARIVKENGVDLPLAERIMDQALGFLRLCAQVRGGSYSPSPMVDIGWHTFILYTREYAEFCQRVAGRFIHHAPSDKVGVNYGTGNVSRTVEAMRLHGIPVDDMLWISHADCGGDCADGGSCGTKAHAKADCNDAGCHTEFKSQPVRANCDGDATGSEEFKLLQY